MLPFGSALSKANMERLAQEPRWLVFYLTACQLEMKASWQIDEEAGMMNVGNKGEEGKREGRRWRSRSEKYLALTLSRNLIIGWWSLVQTECWVSVFVLFKLTLCCTETTHPLGKILLMPSGRHWLGHTHTGVSSDHIMSECSWHHSTDAVQHARYIHICTYRQTQ